MKQCESRPEVSVSVYLIPENILRSVRSHLLQYICMDVSPGFLAKRRWLKLYLHEIKEEKYDSIYKALMEAAPFGMLRLWANCIRLEINAEKDRQTDKQTDGRMDGWTDRKREMMDRQTEMQTHHILDFGWTHRKILNAETIYVFIGVFSKCFHWIQQNQWQKKIQSKRKIAGLEPRISCVRDRDSTTQPQSHRQQSRSLYWTQFMPLWFLRFSELNESCAPFRENSIV